MNYIILQGKTFEVLVKSWLSRFRWSRECNFLLSREQASLLLPEYFGQLEKLFYVCKVEYSPGTLPLTWQ